MHRRLFTLLLGLMVLQLGSGCYRWHNYRMNRIAERGHRVAPACSTCSSCESSPLTAASLGSPVVVPTGPVISAPTLGMPSSAEPPVKMPILSSRPVVTPLGLHR